MDHQSQVFNHIWNRFCQEKKRLKSFSSTYNEKIHMLILKENLCYENIFPVKIFCAEKYVALHFHNKYLFYFTTE